ncbi:alpha-1,4 glucan phosphorylase [Actinocatenispora thailandica]|uniref:glycogen phosphorylase n=1 Tax=Actinocatenispora thailandica TaxID=227318 RepID=A0A7R7HWD4_9ACTN|nr:alpha-glucan family phosphorylase [Actinocatenispora thailandica]BCJ34626.1 alpha-1,4 glucan phosphorylase [Actinocatenispora thailandica]
MRALRRFTVRATLPEPLAALDDIAVNLRWAWHPPTRDLFAAVDPAGWQAVGQDPVRLLAQVSAPRLAQLADDEQFRLRLDAVHADLHRYLTEPRWYQTLPADVPDAIAYFSPEFGITETLPQYSGGLGILAGDHLKAASDLGVPILGVGLLYRAGYFTQGLTADGWQTEQYPTLDPGRLPLDLLRDAAGVPVVIGVGLPEGRQLRAQIWQAHVGRVTLLLLDSDVPDNGPAERAVTDRLYGGGVDHRLVQEALLGIGGIRAVRAWCRVTGAPEPEVYHTNEGHAGFLGLERIRELVESADVDFDTALRIVRSGTVFTTHTPVPAGIDRFPRETIARFFGGDNASPGLPADRILALGAETDPAVFNMAHMGLRLAQHANGVSALHGRVSREMFASLWPGFDVAEVPITSVTNGVHGGTWVSRPGWQLAQRAGVDTSESAAAQTPYETDAFAKVAAMPDADLWAVRRELRADLVAEVRRRLRASALRRGATEAELGWVSDALDEDTLTIGFARRVPSYKRLTLMLADRARLERLLTATDRPVQIVIAGKAHPADEGGKRLIQEMVGFADDPRLRRRIVFLPDYDMRLARHLVAGCDVWLNNPQRPLEACGTSGMKSALNGGLNLSIRDGWWDELYDGRNGWAIPTAAGVADPGRRDALEAGALYELLEQQVVPLFYARGADGVPTGWVEAVRHTLTTLGPRVLAGRMLAEYVERLYLPAAVASRRMAADGGAPGRELAEFAGRATAAWPGVAVDQVEVDEQAVAALGGVLRVRARVRLDRLSPDEVQVQVCTGALGEDGSDELTAVSTEPMRVVDGDGDGYRYVADVPLTRAGAAGCTVRVLPAHPLLASPTDLPLIRYPDQS